MATPPTDALTESAVLAWLEQHPEFLRTHEAQLSQLLTASTPDAAETVVDLQGFMVGRLQQQTRDLREELSELVATSRDNHSAQAQIHHSVLAVLGARTLEQLVEVLTTDLPSRFGVDVIRLGLESPIAHLYDVQYREENYSGICFVPPGVVQDALAGHKARLVPDHRRQHVEGFESIFAECTGLVVSCALLALDLPRTRRAGVLALGSRAPNFFPPQRATELFRFLARTLELRLDELLQSSELDELLNE